MKKYLTIPNLLTVFRMLGTSALAFLPPLTVPFFALYLFCGATDIADGMIARKTGTVSDFGARLDSVADILFYAVILLRLFPTLLVTLPLSVWWLAGAVLVLRFCAYLAAACHYHCFAALHTYLNKCTGALLFALPLLLLTPAAVPISFAVCAMGVLASAEELCLHLCSPAYDANVKSLLCLLRARGEKRQS